MGWWIGDTASAARWLALAGLILTACSPSPRMGPSEAAPAEAQPPLYAEGELPTGKLSVEPGDVFETHDHTIGSARPPAETAAAGVLTDGALEAGIDADLASVGCMSVGRPNAGALINGVQIPDGERYEIIDKHRAWGTPETIHYLTSAIDAVHTVYPDSHPLFIGHMSNEAGGRMWPHRSHQAGRDVDVSYYYVPEKAEWYRPATKTTLDRARSWAFVRALITQTDVQYIFMNTSVQRILKSYALEIGEDPAWLDTVFQYRSRAVEPVIRHAWGHASHMHIRFYNPDAQQLASRAYDMLRKRNIITPRKNYVRHRIVEGDTLLSLAKRYGANAEAIRKMNGFRSLQSVLRVGRVYSIPGRAHVRPARSTTIAARRLPPDPSGGAASRVAAAQAPR